MRRHSSSGRLGFAERGDLQKQISGVDLGMIVGQQIERHCGNLRQQLIERRRVGRGRNSSQCPVQTAASSSHAAEIVKITGFDMLALHRAVPSPACGRGWGEGHRPSRKYAAIGGFQARRLVVNSGETFAPEATAPVPAGGFVRRVALLPLPLAGEGRREGPSLAECSRKRPRDSPSHHYSKNTQRANRGRGESYRPKWWTPHPRFVALGRS